MLQIVELPEKVYPIYVGNRLADVLLKKAASKQHHLELRGELCRVLGITSVKLARWLNNTNQPTLGEAMRCALVLGVAIEDLCDTRTSVQ